MAEVKSNNERRPSAATPRLVMFEVFRRFAGLSFKGTARLLLSDRPLGEGPSPIARADASRTWMSREVVHGTDRMNRAGLFDDCDEGSLRVLSRLKATRGRSTGEILAEFTCGSAAELMLEALELADAAPTLYGNMLVRLKGNRSLNEDERAEIATVLFVAAGCLQDGREAVRAALDFTYATHGKRWDACVQGKADRVGLGHSELPAEALGLGLIRMEDGVMMGGPYWIPSDCGGAIVGMLALGKHDVVEVESDVSDRHARIWCGGEGSWWVEDLCSFAGTTLVRGGVGEGLRLEPRRPERIEPGDSLRFGHSTTYVVVKGARDERRPREAAR